MKSINVSELIEILKKLPQDMPVFHTFDGIIEREELEVFIVNDNVLIGHKMYFEQGEE